MKNTGRKLIIISFVLAILATIPVVIYLESLKEPKEVIKNMTVLVAAETIPARILIDKSMLTSIEVENNIIFNDYIKDSANIVGKYTKETIMKNEGFHKDKLIYEETDELSLKIGTNYRAVTINTTGDSGVAYLIKPGDFVDIIVYLAEKTDGTKIIRPDLAKIVLQNIEVLALDKHLIREYVAVEEELEKAPDNFLVTLSVAYTDLEKIVLAESIGDLKLALRPLKEIDTHETQGITWPELIAAAEENKELNPTLESSSSSDEDSMSDKESTINYVVKRGDTLQKISEAFYGSRVHYELIKKANNIKNKDIIVTGEIIKIPMLEQ